MDGSDDFFLEEGNGILQSCLTLSLSLSIYSFFFLNHKNFKFLAKAGRMYARGRGRKYTQSIPSSLMNRGSIMK